MRKISLAVLIALTVPSLFVTSCKSKKKSSVNTTVINARSMSDPDMLNPINLSSSDGRNISSLMFQALLGIDQDNYQITPVLAVSRPQISTVEEGEFKGGMKLDFEIRPEAQWDNGTPITAEDYIFTLKSILNPLTNCQPLKPYYEWLGDVVVDSANNRKFSVIAREKYFKIEEFAGGYVIPEYIYDPGKTMRKFSVKDMNTEPKRQALKENADIIAFANQFNSEKFQREKGGIVGSGPYAFENWTTGQNITLVRKKNWWGDKIKTRDFLAYPEKIVFKMINDANTAVTALKDGQVDEIHGIEAKLFEELLKNDKVKGKIRLESPSIFAYSFIGFNLKNPKLSEKSVREAFAHCVNKKEINDVLGFGRSTLVESFVHPSQKHYNADLQPYNYDLEAARKLLDEAGWKDSDGDGFRDKVINGEKTKLSLDFKIPSGNKGREQTGILLKEELKKVGIDLVITAREWSVYLQDMDKKNFEVTYGGFTMSSTMSDPKQQWHTSAAVTGGSNSFSFGNAMTDKLIDDIRSDLNDESRSAKYKELQKIIHDEIPCVFMFIPANRLGINKKFDVKLTMIDPGYVYSEFKAAESNQE
jgi:peptide/nickel transport system substrate-binding protein